MSGEHLSLQPCCARPRGGISGRFCALHGAQEWGEMCPYSPGTHSPGYLLAGQTPSPGPGIQFPPLEPSVGALASHATQPGLSPGPGSAVTSSSEPRSPK